MAKRRSEYSRQSEMKCPYALRDEFRGSGYGGSYFTMCDCPGGCEYKKETTKTGRGIIGECTRIVNFTGKDEGMW